MRIVILAPSIYSETSCAMAAHLAASGHIPIGAIAVSSWDRITLIRKLAQWGPKKFASYARGKLISPNGVESNIDNPHLAEFLRHRGSLFRNLRDVGMAYGFPVAVCANQNSPAAVSLLHQWSPDLIVFTGGNILRQPVLDVPRLGVFNVHLAMLPEVRGMSAPEWSLLKGIPRGITIHFMDAGIDTGPVLQRFELRNAESCTSLLDLRNRLIALGVEKAADVVSALRHGAISAHQQSDLEKDNQHFVIHEWLQARASERLRSNHQPVLTEALRG